MDLVSVAVDAALYARAYNGQNSLVPGRGAADGGERIIAAGMTKAVTFALVPGGGV
ncbi:MAG TPA: hypothetical protein VIK60_00405 [Vicinamibacterales bacterium]